MTLFIHIVIFDIQMYLYLYVRIFFVCVDMYHATVVDHLDPVQLSTVSFSYMIVEQQMLSWKMTTTTATTTISHGQVVP